MTDHQSVPPLLTYGEVQYLLRVSRHTIWRMASQRGELVQRKVGSRSLITRESVEAVMMRPLVPSDILPAQ